MCLSVSRKICHFGVGWHVAQMVRPWYVDGRRGDSLDNRGHGLLDVAGLLVFLDSALVEPSGTDLLVLRQEEIWLLVLVAAE